MGATGEQYAHFWGGAETAVQRLGFSLVGLVATVNASALLAVPAATFFLWAPVALAARRNVAARRGRNVGLWRARVVAVDTREADPTPGFYDRTVDARGGPPGRGGWMLSLLVGDASGARVELRTPLARRHADVARATRWSWWWGATITTSRGSRRCARRISRGRERGWGSIRS